MQTESLEHILFAQLLTAKMYKYYIAMKHYENIDLYLKNTLNVLRRGMHVYRREAKFNVHCLVLDIQSVYDILNVSL